MIKLWRLMLLNMFLIFLDTNALSFYTPVDDASFDGLCEDSLSSKYFAE